MASALAELDVARSGEPSGPALIELIELLTPVIQCRVARILLAHGRGRILVDLRAEVEEHVQTVFGQLFEDSGRVLRLWDPGKGLSLKGWVGRFAQLRSRDLLRSARRDPWRHQARPMEHFEAQGIEITPEDDVAAQQLWDEARRRVLEQEQEQGQRMFELLFERDLSTREIRDATGLRDGAIYQWRSRLRRALQAQLQILSSEEGT
ncbi:MAG TPA: sigma-70 family RNA polymerase sigma factor [Deltaproteobacteria bacterium]|nr:sigma-70 family RNA polymerase sigma factor [Deltaproteobacteria bacterium]